MTFSLRINDADGTLIKQYAELNGLNLSEFFRMTTIEFIENKCDMEAYRKMMCDYEKESARFSHSQMKKMVL